jgi:hypothetical protein
LGRLGALILSSAGGDRQWSHLYRNTVTFSHILDAFTCQALIFTEGDSILSESIFMDLCNAWKAQRKEILVTWSIEARPYDFHHHGWTEQLGGELCPRKIAMYCDLALV